MPNDIVEQLRAWAEPISSGYEVPRAAVTLYEAVDEIESLRSRLAEANAKMMLLHNESLSLHTRLAEATGIINQRALELADTQGQLTEAKRYAARYLWLRDRAWPFEFKGDTPEDADAAIDKAMHLAARLAAAKKHTPECSYWGGLMAQVCNCGLTERCCLDYPRCDCNSPPEPAQEPKGCNHFPGQVNCEWCTEVPHE